MIEREILCFGQHGFHRMAYVEWPGPHDARTILCVHGLTRNGRDFDHFAAALSRDFRVICPDMPGRGRSEWLSHVDDYSYPLYLADLAQLLARLDVAAVDWVGTSMGGILGMLMAALPATPIRRLVVNDVGALIAVEGLRRIAGYVGSDPSFPSIDALEAALRRVAASFGPLTDSQWRHLAEHCAMRKADGSFGFAYDPKIAAPFHQSELADIDLWAQWDAISCPTFVLRGAESDILNHDDAVAMTQRGPRAKLVELAGIGHAPALMAADQIALIHEFLLA